MWSLQQQLLDAAVASAKGITAVPQASSSAAAGGATAVAAAAVLDGAQLPRTFAVQQPQLRLVVAQQRSALRDGHLLVAESVTHVRLVYNIAAHMTSPPLPCLMMCSRHMNSPPTSQSSPL